MGKKGGKKVRPARSACPSPAYSVSGPRARSRSISRAVNAALPTRALPWPAASRRCTAARRQRRCQQPPPALPSLTHSHCPAVHRSQNDAKKDAKKEAKKAAQAAILAQSQALKAARDASVDPLEALPPMFRAFSRGGVEGGFESAAAATLAPADNLALAALQEANLALLFGEGQNVARLAHFTEKAKQLADDGSRLLIMRSAGAALPASPAASPSTSPVKKAPGQAAEAEPAVEEEAEPKAVAGGEILAFMNYGFLIEHDVLLMTITDVHVVDSPDVRRKGVGKFMMLLGEMLAKKAGMGGIMTPVLRSNAPGMAFFEACKYTIDNISPSLMDPTAAATEYDSEIYSKVWDVNARAVIDKKAEELRAGNSVEGKAKAAMKAEKDAAAAGMAGIRDKQGRNEFQM